MMMSRGLVLIRRQFILGFVLVATYVGLANAFPCIDYGEGLRIVAEVPLNGGAEDIVLDGTLAYLSGDALRVFDISDPLNPVLLGSAVLPETALRLAVSEGLAFVMSASGLHIIDVADPANPMILGSLDIEDALGVQAEDLSIFDDYIYLASEGGLVVVDASSPTDPSITFYQDDMSGYFWRVVVEDSVAYLSHALLPYGYGILQVFDLGNPRVPRITAELELESQVFTKFMRVKDSRLYLVGWNTTEVIGISDHEKPRVLAIIGFGGQEMVISDDYIFYAKFDLDVVDFSDPSDAELLNVVDICPRARLALSGEYLFAVCGDELQVFNITIPVVSTLGVYSSPIKSRDAESIEFSGNLAFIAAGDAFQIVDVADPGSPRLLADLDLMASHGSRADRLALYGSLVYVTSLNPSDVGSLIIDAADPSNPIVVGSIQAEDSTHRMTVAGDHAYVAVGSPTQTSGMRIYDLSDPLHPESLSFIALDYPNHIAVQDGFAYVGNGGDLNVIDISDPAEPRIVGSVFTTGYAAEVFVQGSYAYINAIRGLRTVDVSDPESPNLAGYYAVPTFVQDIDLVGDHVYLATGAGGLSIVDVGDPVDLRRIGGYFDGLYCFRCDAGEGALMVQQEGSSHHDETLKLLPLQCGSDAPARIAPSHFPTRDVSSFPNPAIRESTIRFVLTTTSHVRVSVHDMNGRLVRTLADHGMGRGDHRLSWDGRDDTGRRLAAGIYLLRVETAEGQIQTGRSVLLR